MFEKIKIFSNIYMYYKQLNGFVLQPHTRIEDNLLHRQSATIAEREDELKAQIKNKNVFFGAGEMDALNARMDEFENDLMSVIDEKLELLETKIKLADLYQDEDDDSSSDDSDSEPEHEPESETESEPETDDDDSSDEENDTGLTKQEKRRKYLKDYHQKYYLKNKADKLKRQLKQQ